MLKQGHTLKIAQRASVALLVILTTVMFFNAPGTVDVRFWREWIKNADAYGLVPGFRANSDLYPPFASTILVITSRASRLFGGGAFDAVKLSILLFLFLTSFVFWLWTRSFTMTVILHCSLLLNSIALGYLDILIAPSLVLSLWALKQHRLTWFAVFYSIACLTKWQPLLISPFIALYILNISQVAQLKQVEARRLFWGVLFPAIAIFVVTLSIFGVNEVGQAFTAGTQGYYLSGDALNFNWLVTHFLHILYPDRFGRLIGGRSDLIQAPPLEVTLIPRLLFVLSYVITVLSFLRHDKTFENLVTFSLIGYLAYFTFNINVHENHLFLAAILSIILFWVNRKHLTSMFIVVLMSNINLLLFFGINGDGLGFSRVMAREIDIALLLSFFNVGYFSSLWVANVLLSKDTQSGQQPVDADLTGPPNN